MKSAITTTAAVLLALIAGPALVGCAAVGDVVKNATGGQVDVGGTEVPDGFPVEVPLYDGEVIAGGSVGDDANRVYNVTIAVADGAAFDTIAAQLEEAGFTSPAQLAPAPADGATGAFANADYGVLVVVGKDGGEGFVANYTVTSAAE
jgi:hypothetical protein